MSVVRCQLQRTFEVMQCFVISAHARLEKSALPIGLAISRILGNGFAALSDLSSEITINRFVRSHRLIQCESCLAIGLAIVFDSVPSSHFWLSLPGLEMRCRRDRRDLMARMTESIDERKCIFPDF